MPAKGLKSFKRKSLHKEEFQAIPMKQLVNSKGCWKFCVLKYRMAKE